MSFRGLKMELEEKIAYWKEVKKDVTKELESATRVKSRLESKLERVNAEIKLGEKLLSESKSDD